MTNSLVEHIFKVRHSTQPLSFNQIRLSQIIFAKWACNVSLPPHVSSTTSSLTGRWAFRQVYISHVLLKIIPFALHTSHLWVHALQSRSCMLHTLRYKGSLVTWMVVSLTKSKLCYDRRWVGQSVLVSSTPSGAYDQICITVRQLWVCCCGALSLTTERVCRLQLLLVLASAVILEFESRRTREHILLLRFETPPTWRTRSPYLYPTATGWPSYTPRHSVHFSSPPTTRSGTVEVFEPASTRGPLTVSPKLSSL
jgi:hypothetical protein